MVKLNQSYTSPPPRASVFTHQKFISVKIVVHTLFQVKVVFTKYLEQILYFEMDHKTHDITFELWLFRGKGQLP